MPHTALESLYGEGDHAESSTQVHTKVIYFELFPLALCASDVPIRPAVIIIWHNSRSSLFDAHGGRTTWRLVIALFDYIINVNVAPEKSSIDALLPLRLEDTKLQRKCLHYNFLN